MTAKDSQPVRRRPGGRSARVRSAVLMAALDALADGGYGSFTCEAVAERAGVHKTTVYRRWGKRWRIIDLACRETYTTKLLPDFTLTAGDLMITVGTSEALDRAFKILKHG